MTIKKTKVWLALFLPIQYFLLLLLRVFPDYIETYYSNGLYPYLGKLLRYTFGWIPFSIGDLFYLGLLLLLLKWLIKNFKNLWKNPRDFFIEALATVSIVYFTFQLVWGLNYLRNPLYKSLDLDKNYTTKELLVVTTKIIDRANTLHRELGYKDSVKIELPYSQEEIFSLSAKGYKNLSQKYPQFKYQPISIKESLWSLGLTYMGYSGYYNPFTGEAQVNKLIKNYKSPVVSCHEQAHQIGYAAENEANFIATLANIHNDDKYMVYTGYIFALRYCVNELARRDMALYEKILPTINFGILEGYREMREFWAKYENPFEDVSKNFWDQFLKANNQSKGINSYSYMVALVVNYFEVNELL